MTEITKRKLVGLLSFVVSLLVTWLTGATSSAREHSQDLSLSSRTSSWQSARQKLELSTSSSSLPSLTPGEVGGLDVQAIAKEQKIMVAAYESESPSVKKGSGTNPIPLHLFVPKSNGGYEPTSDNERMTLERFLNIEVRIRKQAERCETRAKIEGTPYICISEVLEELGDRLEREAKRGSAVAEAAVPIVRQMAVEVREADSSEEALAAIQRGIGKVQQIRVVRSQDIVIANRQRQQRAVLTETLQAVEISLAKAIAI
ncbi:hypothetical protein ABLO27_03120 [Roseibium sp. SCPC15]|uniref:hypothetical protein n=1 Tax=Roseibium sp. SCP15 TaxID=3141376 RepID=UPI003334FBFB